MHYLRYKICLILFFLVLFLLFLLGSKNQEREWSWRKSEQELYELYVAKYYYSDQNVMKRACISLGQDNHSQKSLVEKPEVKKSRGRQRLKWTKIKEIIKLR